VGKPGDGTRGFDDPSHLVAGERTRLPELVHDRSGRRLNRRAWAAQESNL